MAGETFLVMSINSVGSYNVTIVFEIECKYTVWDSSENFLLWQQSVNLKDARQPHEIFLNNISLSYLRSGTGVMVDKSYVYIGVFTPGLW